MIYYNNPKNYNWFRQSGPFSYILKKEMNSVKLILDSIEYKSILDVGCGTGIYTSIIPKDKFYMGIDPDIEMYQFCLSKKIKCYNASIENFIAEDKFDVVLFSGSFEFIENKFSAINKCAKILNKNGKIIIITPRRCMIGYIYAIFHNIIGNNVELYDDDMHLSSNIKLVFRRRVNFIVDVFMYVNIWPDNA